jgi:hypothetical protein
MSKLSIKTEHKNYLAKVVKLGELRKHPGADKLQIAFIDGQNVITGLNAKEGDIYIYFPLESRLNSDYLSWSNSYSKTELNVDKTAKGFFPSASRVKTAELRGIYSEGYIVPVQSLVDWLNSIKIKATVSDFEVGVEFSHFGETFIADKYINFDAVRRAQNLERNAANKKGKVKRESKLVDNQFRLHLDTSPLKKNLSAIHPNDFISISEKIHGTSGVFSKVLCKKNLRWYEKILKKLGVQVVDTQYDYLWSSRKVIKNAYADKKSESFYDVDIWGIVAKELNPFLKDGMSFYVEIFGQLPNGKHIQKDFDYGTRPNEHSYAIYRITYTNPSGEVFEFTEHQMLLFCKKYNLKAVPYHYIGYAKNLFESQWVNPTDDRDLEKWREDFLNYLLPRYTEMNCPMCVNKVPREGVVVRRFNDYADVYKLKSLAFISREANEAEAGEVDVETQESVSAENKG